MSTSTASSHAWAAHPNYGLLATVLGVRRRRAGFRTVLVTPALGPLRHVQGRIPYPLGNIDMALEHDGPTGLRATVTLPAGLSRALVWHGRRVPLRAGREDLRFQ